MLLLPQLRSILFNRPRVQSYFILGLASQRERLIIAGSTPFLSLSQQRNYLLIITRIGVSDFTDTNDFRLFSVCMFKTKTGYKSV